MVWPCGAYSWCTTPRESKKTVNMTLTLLWTSCGFFGLRDDECCHCDDCILVSGSYLYTHVSSPVITVFRKLGSLLALSSMSCVMSRRHCFYSIVSSFSINFADTFLMPKSLCKIECTNPMLTFVSFAISQTVIRILQDQSPHLLNDIVIPTCWGPTWTWFTVHWCPAIFEAVVPLLDARCAHGIVSESLLNLANGFCLGIAKLLAKFDSILLLKFSTRIHSLADCQQLMLSSGRKKFTNAHACPLYILHWRKSPTLHWFMLEKNKKLGLILFEQCGIYTFNTKKFCHYYWKSETLEVESINKNYI